MIAPYLRSSCLSTLELCEQSFFLQYSLGLQQIVGRSAEKGTIFHKVFEIVAKIKLENEKGKVYVDDEYGEFKTEIISDQYIYEILTKVYSDYTEKSDLDWSYTDYMDLRKWVKTLIEYNDGEYDPRNRNIVFAEKFFDFPLIRPWTKYKFTVDDNLIEGNVGLRGTVDLITQVSGQPKVWEIIDYKTGGSRRNWATDKTKDESNLKDDIQLRFYHYALNHLYPDVDDIVITLFFLQAGGPFSVFFNKADAIETEEMLKKKYQEIVNTTKPKLRSDYKCKWCSFFTGNFKNSGKSPCVFFRDKIITDGMSKVIDEYANIKKLRQYQGGGSVRD